MIDKSGDKPIDDSPDPEELFDPRQWAMHGLLSTYYDLQAKRACPPVSDLWLHASEAKPLNTHEAHLQDCPRCRKHLQLIRRELEGTTPSTADRTAGPQGAAGFSPRGITGATGDLPASAMSDQGAAGFSPRDAAPAKSVQPYRFPIVWIAGGLAVAASLTLLVLIWPELTRDTGRFGSQIAMVFNAVDLHGSSQPRGAEGDRAFPAADQPEWLQSLRSDRAAAQAFSEHVLLEPTLFTEYSAGRLQLRDNRLHLAPKIDEQSFKGRQLIEWLKQDNELCEKIVDALIRHLPDASENNRAQIRSALDHWRANQVFGADQ